ncbi:MAG: hypothetical protein OXC66_09985 [Roseovarius sp.]|nr:hypothetical protein [Roseovarius sp.]
MELSADWITLAGVVGIFGFLWKISGDMRKEIGEIRKEIRKEIGDMRKEIGELRERMAKLEGLFEGFAEYAKVNLRLPTGGKPT